MMKKVLKIENILTIGFLLVIFFAAGAVFYHSIEGSGLISSLKGTGSVNIRQIAYQALKETNANLPCRNELIDLNGLEIRLLGKHVVVDAGAEVVKGGDGYLYFPNPKIGDASYAATQIEKMIAYFNQQGIPYVLSPIPFKSGYREEYLPRGITDKTTEMRAQVLSSIQTEGINALELPAELSYYKTDHHWRVESAFDTALLTINALEASGVDVETDSVLRDKTNYQFRDLGKCFLGTIGRRTGALFAGKDNFVYVLPQFETSFSFESYIGGEITLTKTGSFEEALIEKPIDTGYDPDWYSTYMNNEYVEERIFNNEIPQNGAKLLIVGDSYARPYGCFMSLFFRETRVLDIQEGRFDGSIPEYIEQFEPDAVVMLFSDAEFYAPGFLDFGGADY